MHYRQIDVSDCDAITPREQPAPMLEWVRVDKLRIDTRYQRDLGAANWKAIHRIAANFDWCAFGPILCAPIEGGLYAVIDGQHRAHAAAICMIESVPAMIVPVPPQRQAVAFVQINSGIRVTPHHTYRAELAAGNQLAVAMNHACVDAGCTLATSNPSAKHRKPQTIYCIGTVRRMVKNGQADHLTAALRAIVAYDTKGRVALYSDYILTPLVEAISKTGVTDTNTLHRALSNRDPFTTLAQAEAVAIANKQPAQRARIMALCAQISGAAQ